MGDITKLPKWAQDELASRDRVIEVLREEIAELTADHKGSNVVMRVNLRYKYLPPDARLIFYMEPDPGDGKKLRDGIEVHHQHDAYGPELILRSNGDRLNVMPSASNSVRVRIGR